MIKTSDRRQWLRSDVFIVNPLSANLQKWLSTLKQFAANSEFLGIGDERAFFEQISYFCLLFLLLTLNKQILDGNDRKFNVDKGV